MFGVIIFLLLYFYAASVYPGGNQLENSIIGYSHIKNFWCDLLDSVAYIGKESPSRPIALIATIILPVTLVSFYYFLPLFLIGSAWQHTAIRWLGCVAMVLAIFLPIAHDLILNVVPILMIATVLMILISLFQRQRMILFFIGFLSIVFLACNYLIWLLDFYSEFMPIVQKLAILTFLFWISMITCQYNCHYK